MDATAVPPDRSAQQAVRPPDRSASPFERFGGHDFFDVLIARFYAGVAADPVLRPMYPEEDLGPAAERLQLFLEQYWGGPTTYSQERGHPRLRMRHAPFPVDGAAHDAWLRHMRAALDEAAATFSLGPDDETELWDYLQRAAFAMVNTFPGPA
jgi:hemoglobin